MAVRVRLSTEELVLIRNQRSEHLCELLLGKITRQELKMRYAAFKQQEYPDILVVDLSDKEITVHPEYYDARMGEHLARLQNQLTPRNPFLNPVFLVCAIATIVGLALLWYLRTYHPDVKSFTLPWLNIEVPL